MDPSMTHSTKEAQVEGSATIKADKDERIRLDEVNGRSR